MADTNITTIRTSAQIPDALPMRVKNHGLTLVHDITGNKRNWLHEVSVRDNLGAPYGVAV